MTVNELRRRNKKKVTTKTENKLLSRIPLHTDGGVTVYDVRHTLPEVPGINGRGIYKKKYNRRPTAIGFQAIADRILS